MRFAVSLARALATLPLAVLGHIRAPQLCRGALHQASDMASSSRADLSSIRRLQTKHSREQLVHDSAREDAGVAPVAGAGGGAGVRGSRGAGRGRGQTRSRSRLTGAAAASRKHAPRFKLKAGASAEASCIVAGAERARAAPTHPAWYCV